MEMNIMPPLDIKYGKTRNNHVIIGSNSLRLSDELRKSQFEREKSEIIAAGK